MRGRRQESSCQHLLFEASARPQMSTEEEGEEKHEIRFGRSDSSRYMVTFSIPNLYRRTLILRYHNQSSQMRPSLVSDSQMR
jgi:hypothetical protein